MLGRKQNHARTEGAAEEGGQKIVLLSGLVFGGAGIEL